MATPATSKKIQRVQKSGVKRRAGQRRNLGFPVLLTAIMVVGIVLVFLARDARINQGGDQPRASRDKWYEAYGFYACDAYLGVDAPPAEPADISALGNGIIGVFPLSEATAGDNATIGKYFEAQGIKVTDTSVTLADGTQYKAGDACGVGKKKTTKTSIKLFVWPPQASGKTEPEVVTSDFGSHRFEQDKGAYALALVPTSTDKIDLPNSVTSLDNPEATAQTAPPATVAPEGAEGTVAPETTTAPASSEAPATTPTTESAPTTTEG